MSDEDFGVLVLLILYFCAIILFTGLFRIFCKNVFVVSTLSGVVPGVAWYLVMRHVFGEVDPFALALPVLYFPVTFTLSAVAYWIMNWWAKWC